MVAAFIAFFSTFSVYYVNADDYAYDYKVKYSKWQTKWTKYKLAGNQCREGYHFRSGKGSFHWSDSGKKSPSVSLGYSPDGNFHKFSVSVSFGNRTSNGGMEVTIEDKPSYAKKHMYKLYVKRKVKARQKKPIGNAGIKRVRNGNVTAQPMKRKSLAFRWIHVVLECTSNTEHKKRLLTRNI